MTAAFTYVDLFAGVGGFAAALEAMGGEQVYAVEIDKAAAAVYYRNWGHDPHGDITEDASDTVMRIGPHDVLTGGFPCQPFSKSGAQRGMDETRGTLFFNIMSAIKANKPTLIVLENVRNLVGPRHRHEWDLIKTLLRAEGYRVSEDAAVVSPHQIDERFGGAPQVRERVFITATYDPDAPIDPLVEPVSLPAHVRKQGTWHLEDILDPTTDIPGTGITSTERIWIEHWEAGVQMMREMRVWQADRAGEPARRLPGFPIWIDCWDVPQDEQSLWAAQVPPWKANFYRKNWEFAAEMRSWALAAGRSAELDAWLRRFADFPESRRKLEWQAQDAASLKECVISLRPSGLRVKQMTHLPALVAITQTPILMPLGRRLSPREAARLQGLPDNFDFGDQSDALTYKQLGNGVNTGVVWNVMKAHCVRDHHVLERTEAGRRILDAVLGAPEHPGRALQEAVERGQRRFREKTRTCMETGALVQA